MVSVDNQGDNCGDLWPDPTDDSTCRVMFTRRCPKSFGPNGCKDKPCARFESDDEGPWLADIAAEGHEDDCDYDDDLADAMTPDEVWTEGGIKD